MTPLRKTNRQAKDKEYTTEKQSLDISVKRTHPEYSKDSYNSILNIKPEFFKKNKQNN